MKRIASVTAISIAVILAIPATAMAVETASPRASAINVSSAKPLTQQQKDAIAEARVAFTIAKKNAMQGFDRAVADAQAIRDQAITEAGTNQVALRVAKKDYLQSYNVILRAYKIDLADARGILTKAIAGAKTW